MYNNESIYDVCTLEVNIRSCSRHGDFTATGRFSEGGGEFPWIFQENSSLGGGDFPWIFQRPHSENPGKSPPFPGVGGVGITTDCSIIIINKSILVMSEASEA